MEEKELRLLGCIDAAERRDSDSTAGGTGKMVIVGYAAKFNEWSEPINGWFREMIAPGAFDDADITECVCVFNHDNSRLLGRVSSGTLAITVDEKGLKFECELPDTVEGRDIFTLISRRDITQCSFCFTVAEVSWKWADENEGLELDERTIMKVGKVFDVSPVVFPAYKGTEVDARALADKEEHTKFRLLPDDIRKANVLLTQKSSRS